MKKLLILTSSWLVCSTFANAASVVEKVEPVEVGKHVTANMDAMSMILSLLMVLAVIVVSAVILKRFSRCST